MKGTTGLEESTDWHLGAALKFRAALKENGQLAALRIAVRKPNWIIENHMFFGMAVRNWLRSHGYREQDVDVANLDDHYIPVMLLAVGYEVEGGYDNWNLTDLHKRLTPITGKSSQSE